jgi:hypothetical protein
MMRGFVFVQAEFSSVPALKEGTGKVSCTGASISWRPPVDSIQRPVFVLGYCSSSQQVGPAKVWEFAEAYQRWQLLTELAEPNEKLEPVHHVSWAPNVGRPYELIAVSSGRAVSIWRLEFSSDSQGRISVSRVAHLQDHNSEVCVAYKSFCNVYFGFLTVHFMMSESLSDTLGCSVTMDAGLSAEFFWRPSGCRNL